MTHFDLRSTTLALAMLGLATPALAQNVCGGAGNNGQWIGGSEGASDIATASTYQEQMALVLGGNEYVSLFSLSAPATVRVEAAGRGAGDPLIDLLDANGSILLSDDDSGGNGASRAETDLQPGTYCMAMRSYDGAPMTAFVRIGRTEHEALTVGSGTTSTTTTTTTTTTADPGGSGGSCASATTIPYDPAGASATSSVDAGGYFSFTLNAPSPVSITAVNESADPLVTLYDANENYLGENDDYDGLNSRLDMTAPLQPGTYCIALDALSDTSLPITVTVSEYDPEAALASLVAQGEAAPPMDGSVQITALGDLKSRMRQDANVTHEVTWFSLDASQGGLLLIEAISADGSGDPWLVVYDDLGRLVGQNDDHGDGLDSLVTARVNPGTFLVGVKLLGDVGTSGFVRMVFERYVPAP